MNLYLIKRTDDWGYDDYDSAVVCAESEEHARNTHPVGGTISEHGGYRCWVTDTKLVNVELIGHAEPFMPAGVVCASFNAG